MDRRFALCYTNHSDWGTGPAREKRNTGQENCPAESVKMGLFGKKKVSVTVHGSTSTMTGSDGRYAKQARSLKKAGRERARNLDLVARSARELCSYIESTYKVEPLPEEDALFRRRQCRDAQDQGNDERHAQCLFKSSFVVFFHIPGLIIPSKNPQKSSMSLLIEVD